MADPADDFGEAAIAGRHGRPDGPPGLVVEIAAGFAVAGVATRAERVAELATRARQAFALALPSGPRHAGAAGGEVGFVGTAPGRWFALAEGRAGPDFEAALRGVFAEYAAICDLSDALGLVHLSGPRLRAVLAKCVAIDLHPTAFPVGAAATTGFALIGVTLWRTEAGIALLYPRSYAGSLWQHLAASAAEYGCEARRR